MSLRVRASVQPRDQNESAFTAILAVLVKRVPGAYAAVLVDSDGEAVDYAGAADPFDIKVAGAHWGIALDEIVRQRNFSNLRSIVCRGAQRSFITRGLPERYALVIMLKHRAGFAVCERALDACERALAHEALWTLPKGRGIWVAVDVDVDARGRPTWLNMGTLSSSVEVLGAMTRLGGRERGFRVRLPSGGELNLVREPGNHWYADEKLA